MNILEVKGLHKSFGDRQVLNGCSLKVGEGRIIGLLGPSGAGKSTLLRCIAGLLRPEWGTIRLRGEEIRPKDRPRIAYLADHTLLPGGLYVRDACAYYLDLFPTADRERVWREVERHHIPWERRVRDLSRGEAEQLELLLLLQREAELYLLDEPLGGVDPVTRREILRELMDSMDGTRSILLSTHLVHDMEPVLDEAVFLRHGAVALHAPAEEIRAVHGCSVEEHYLHVFGKEGTV